MPVLKVKNNGVWEEIVGGNSGGASAENGYSIYYINDNTFDDLEHVDGEEIFFGVNVLSLSNQGVGVKKGDLLIYKTGVLGIVIKVDYPVVHAQTIANIAGRASFDTENWIFTFEDGSTVTKAVHVG